MEFRGIPLLKRLIPSARKRIAAITWPGGFRIVRRHGVLLLLNYRNYVDRELLFYGRYERDQIETLTAAIVRHGCDIFLDVGANIGLYSLIAATRRLAGEVIAFEPDTRSLGALRTNLLINGIADIVEVRPIALSDHDGVVRFALDAGSSSCRSKVSEDGTVAVSCAKLDTLLPVSGKRLFFKIDIEGHELSALDGMRGVLEHNRCFLQIESFAANAPALDEVMRQRGYQRHTQVGHDHYYANF